MTLDKTAEQSWNRAAGGALESKPRPGAAKVFSAGAACFVPRVLDRGRALVGRDADCDLVGDDASMSRHHAEVRFDGEAWRVEDLGSRNGTFLDGVRAPHTGGPRGVLAAGDTLFLLCDDVRPFLAQTVEVKDGIVIGPTLRRAWREVERVAQASSVVHLNGETGCGKELAARRFHDAGPRASGPLVTLNCAALPTTIAERLLFGARRGAYSGADTNAEGYLAAADGGTLFLDEVAELPLEVQAKLLRVVEDRELLPLGATRPRQIDIRFVTATHGDLRVLASSGRFRQDLYFRLGKPVVPLPPLQERLEDVSFLVERALSQLPQPRQPHVSLVEAALVRAWPGNVRELLREIAEAAGRAPGAARVRAEHLDARAGRALTATMVTGVARASVRGAGAQPEPSAAAGETPAPEGSEASAAASKTPALEGAVERRRIIEALEQCAGNQTRAAKLLGMSLRTLVSRLAKHNVARPRKRT